MGIVVVPSTTMRSTATLSSVGTVGTANWTDNLPVRSPRYGYPMVNDRQTLDLTTFKASSPGPVEWRISDRPVDYLEAVAAMEARVAAIAAGEAGELVWLLEHPPLYTSGTSGKQSDLLDPRFPLFASGRGGP